MVTEGKFLDPTTKRFTAQLMTYNAELRKLTYHEVTRTRLRGGTWESADTLSVVRMQQVQLAQFPQGGRGTKRLERWNGPRRRGVIVWRAGSAPLR